MKQKLFFAGEDLCDYWFVLGRFELFVWKRADWEKINWKDWDIGRKAGDGLFAIRTPWFLLYLE